MSSTSYQSASQLVEAAAELSGAVRGADFDALAMGAEYRVATRNRAMVQAMQLLAHRGGWRFDYAEGVAVILPPA